MEINNRKANYDYEIIDTIETGIVLKGTEIKYIAFFIMTNMHIK